MGKQNRKSEPIDFDALDTHTMTESQGLHETQPKAMGLIAGALKVDSNLDPGTKHGQMRIVQAVVGAGEGLKAQVNKVLSIASYVIYEKQKIDPDTGELLPGEVLSLFTTDGCAYGTNSNTAIKAWRAILSFTAVHEFAEGVKVVVRSRQTSGGDVVWVEPLA